MVLGLTTSKRFSSFYSFLHILIHTFGKYASYRSRTISFITQVISGYEIVNFIFLHAPFESTFWRGCHLRITMNPWLFSNPNMADHHAENVQSFSKFSCSFFIQWHWINKFLASIAKEFSSIHILVSKSQIGQ